MEFSLIPLDKEATLSHYLARVTSLIRESGLAHQLGPLSACVEGEWEELMTLTTRCFNNLSRDCRHIQMVTRVIWRADRIQRLPRA